jgi:hypothetical protein
VLDFGCHTYPVDFCLSQCLRVSLLFKLIEFSKLRQAATDFKRDLINFTRVFDVEHISFVEIYHQFCCL